MTRTGPVFAVALQEHVQSELVERHRAARVMPVNISMGNHWRVNAALTRAGDSGALQDQHDQGHCGGKQVPAEYHYGWRWGRALRRVRPYGFLSCSSSSFFLLRRQFVPNVYLPRPQRQLPAREVDQVRDAAGDSFCGRCASA